MATIYNITEAGLTNVTNLYDYAVGANNLSNGLFGVGFLIAGFFITFASLKGWGVKDAYSSTSFLMAVMAVFFWAMQLITDVFLYIFIFLAVLGVIVLTTGD